MATGGTKTKEEFVEAWRGRKLSERQAAQAHFIALCRLLGVQAPYDDPARDPDYCFEAVTASPGSPLYAAAKKKRRESAGAGPDPQHHLWQGAGVTLADTAGDPEVVSAKGTSHGFCDAWLRGRFCWEYKRQGVHADLDAALRQLKEYKDSLYNPPLLIVSDIETTEIHTNFTGHPPTKFTIRLDDIAEPEAFQKQHGVSPLGALRYAFEDPDWFRPKERLDDITAERAEQVGKLARRVGDRKDPDGEKHDPQAIAHYFMQLVFCMYAEDVRLLNAELFTGLARDYHQKPDDFAKLCRDLFRSMAEGGHFGPIRIDHFNGGLFSDVDDQFIPRLTPSEIGELLLIAGKDWTNLEPSILGTLFERFLDPEKRSQIGAHYTSRADILDVIGPVVLEPLVREWAACQKKVGELIAQREDAPKNKKLAIENRIHKQIHKYHDRLASVRVLDPACGSGNFLYVTIQELLTLEQRVRNFASQDDVRLTLKPKVGPHQLHGIEINRYAAELARVSIWIGYLKWQRDNGLVSEQRPILQALDTIRCADAILRRGEAPQEDVRFRPAGSEWYIPTWPEADFIVGNPPFLGVRMFRKYGIEDDYIEALHALFGIDNTSDLCCYWFELARQDIVNNPHVRAGLLATQGIRGGSNRSVLERIKESGDIFMAWQDREWILDGAAVHVSIVGFDSARELTRVIDGITVGTIHSDLTCHTDTTSAHKLSDNRDLSFMGDTKGGPFDIDLKLTISLLAKTNPDSRTNSEVLFPWINGKDITARRRGAWIIDFGVGTPKSEAVLYDGPFALTERLCQTARESTRQTRERDEWWLHVRPRPLMREALYELPRYLGTPATTKHRLFSWHEHPTLPDHAVIVFARSDDYFFGVLHSSIHEAWARRVGTQLREATSGFRYTPTTCFETFPLPWAPGDEPTKGGEPGHAAWAAIRKAAAELDGLREGWLNPPKLVAEVEALVDRKYKLDFAEVPEEARDMVRKSAIHAESAVHPKLKKLTLTNLYNERPAWLRFAHKALDEAVIRAYAEVDPAGGWDPAWAVAFEPFGAGEIEIKRPEQVTGRAKPDAPEVIAAKERALAERTPVVEKILAALLRLNGERAGSG